VRVAIPAIKPCAQNLEQGFILDRARLNIRKQAKHAHQHEAGITLTTSRLTKLLVCVLCH
jgi:hypothetical protein